MAKSPIIAQNEEKEEILAYIAKIFAIVVLFYCISIIYIIADYPIVKLL